MESKSYLCKCGHVTFHDAKYYWLEIVDDVLKATKIAIISSCLVKQE